MSRGPWLAAALLALPVIVYWPTISHEYGFRDDYAHLREVRERPGWLTRLTTANGRPVFGVVLEASVRQVHTVAALSGLRLTGAVLLSIFGVLLWVYLRRVGWSEGEAAAFGAAAQLLPGAQVIVGWAIAWPIGLGLVAAVAGFIGVDAGLKRTGRRRALYVAVGAALYLLAGLTYQTSALFAVPLLAAALLVREQGSARRDARWLAAHIGTLFMSLVAGYLALNVIFAEGVVSEAERMRLEPDPFLKLLWFARQPLPNALGLFALRDRLAEYASFWIAFAAMAALVAAGYRYGATTRLTRLRWWFVLLALPFVAHSVSLAASSQAIGYRTLLPLSGLALVLVVFALRALAARWRLTPGVAAAALGVLVAAAALEARHTAFTLIAEPQGREWQLVKAAAAKVTLLADTRVYIIRPALDDRSTQHVYEDEYGSLSADAEWAAEEMFKTAMRERFPGGLPAGTSYSLTTGFSPPTGAFDLVLDMRPLAGMGDRSAVGS